MNNTNWPKRPLIYEINTPVWLHEIAQGLGRSVTLANVPTVVWDALADLSVDAVWFMGVWDRSPAGKAIAAKVPDWVEDFNRSLPDWGEADNIGSAYCIGRYRVAAALGGALGLAVARRELHRRGLRLLLDFVPNHCAQDHPWVENHPEYFIQGTDQDLANGPSAFFRAGERVLACGRDPYLPAWPDVAQLNLFAHEVRVELIVALLEIARQCDGVRCDMAMLALNEVFARCWGERIGCAFPQSEFWTQAIYAVRHEYPGFLFIAESYWDTEWTLQQLGFDYCYDKRLYDRLLAADPPALRAHLTADVGFQDKLIRFIENHDELRAAAAFSPPQAQASAILATALPGAKLLHEGQLDGRRQRVPVFLARRPVEGADAETAGFYARLLRLLTDPVLREGEWALLDCQAWPDNPSAANLLAWGYRSQAQHRLIVVNYSASPAQALIRLPWAWVEWRGQAIQLVDALHDTAYACDVEEINGKGLYVSLNAWGAHWFTFSQ